MKMVLPDKVEDGRIAGPPGTNTGAFRIRVNSSTLRIIASDGGGWDHVSVSLSSRCPTWEEMCKVKTLFFEDDEWVVQFHPAKSGYVNNHQFCLHLWKPQTAEDQQKVRAQWAAEGEVYPYPDCEPPGAMPTPEEWMVGIK